MCEGIWQAVLGREVRISMGGVFLLEAVLGREVRISGGGSILGEF